MAELSPDAQAVVDAAITGRGYLQPAIAAALAQPELEDIKYGTYRCELKGQ